MRQSDSVTLLVKFSSVIMIITAESLGLKFEVSQGSVIASWAKELVGIKFNIWLTSSSYW